MFSQLRIPGNHMKKKKKKRSIRKHSLPGSQAAGSFNTRIAGYDIARGLAIFFMIIINFNCVFSGDESDPVWLSQLVSEFEGRAAVTFVVLSGVGITLLCRQARLSGDQAGMRENKNILLKRAFILMTGGLIFCHTWPADILHFYGAYLVISVFFLNASDKKLLLASFFSAIVFYILLFSFDYNAGWNSDTSYDELFTFDGMIRDLFFNGAYPIFPWMAFLFVGMWLGRQDTYHRVFRKKVLFSACCMIVAAELISSYLNRIYLTTESFEVRGIIIHCRTVPENVRDWIDIIPFPPSPLFMLSGGATALMVIMLSITLAKKYPEAKWLKFSEAAGQLSLTLYVAHVVFGINVLELIEFNENGAILSSVTAALVFIAGSFSFAFFWKKRWKKGPLEWIMRWFSEHPVLFMRPNMKTCEVSKNSQV